MSRATAPLLSASDRDPVADTCASGAVEIVASAWAAARMAVARRLESSSSPGIPARLLASGWSVVSARRVARRLELPPGVRAIGVGGATLGGDCKTPFAIALATALAARGIDVALVGHAYRARPSRARIVRPNDDVAEVGDDALFAARRLASSHIDVVVAPSRQAAATFAARRGRYLVFDGLLQARPRRLARAILLVDGERSFCDAHCPPAGDLRAPPHALLRAADTVVAVGDVLDGAEAVSHLEQARCADGRAVPLADLRGARLGLLLTIARPGRVIAGLARRGLCPVATFVFPDHHRPTAAELGRATARTTHRIDAWLVTGKCATKLPSSLAGAPVLALEHAVQLSDRLVTWAASDGPPLPRDFAPAAADALFPTAGRVG